MFLGDLAFGDERRKREKKEKQAAEEMLLQAKRHDEQEKERFDKHDLKKSAPKAADKSRQDRAHRAQPAKKPQRYTSRYDTGDDDFDYSKYTDEMDKELDERVNRLLNDE